MAKSLEHFSGPAYPQELSKLVIDATKTPMSGIEAIARALEAAAPVHGKKWETIHELNRYFLEKLRSGEFRCFAFEHPRSIHSAPVELKPEHWTAAPDWERGEFKANGLHLVELRFLPASQQVPLQQAAEVKKTGRPGFYEDIIAAYLALKESGEFIEKPLTASVPLINAWIKHNRPTSKVAQKPKGAGEQSIRNALKAYKETEIP